MGTTYKTFLEYLKDIKQIEILLLFKYETFDCENDQPVLMESKNIKRKLLIEYELYKNIPPTRNSYRTDTQNISANSKKHVHVYSKPNGKGKELYSVDIDGKGRHGFNNYEIPKNHADFFRNKGYKINSDNVLESKNLDDLNPENFEIIFLLAD